MTAKGPLPAISGLKSVHVTSQEERSRVTPRDDIFLDVEAVSKEEAEVLGIRPGDAIVPASSFQEFAHGRYVGKALDDRVGCVMLLETLHRIKEQGIRTPNTIYFVGTVQEEVWFTGRPYSRRRSQSRSRNLIGGRYRGRPPRRSPRLGARTFGGGARDLPCRRTDAGEP